MTSNNLCNDMSELSLTKEEKKEANENVFSNIKELACVTDILGYGPKVTAQMASNLPKVDFGTFSPLLGTKFFCFNPSSLVQVTEEIHSYLNDFTANVNYDFDAATHTWKCSETSGYDTVDFIISLYESNSSDKVFVKFHRLSGTPAIFSASIERFSKLSYIMNELKVVDPSDQSETDITSPGVGTKKRKGCFKAMPLPLTVRQKTVSSSEFISYCEIFNIWAQSDVQECLSSILTSMPKMWKDLTLFYKGVESLGSYESSESTNELILMFSSINKIYKNLCSIAVHSFYALHNNATRNEVVLEAEVVVAPVYVAPEPVYIEAEPVAATQQTDYLGDYTHNYDFLDFDEGEQMDGTAGYGDDFHYGADASRNNEGNRHTVTMDISKGNYRSMAVFEGRGENAYVSAAEMKNDDQITSIDVSGGKQTSGAGSSQLYEINMNTKTHRPVHHETLFEKLASSADTQHAASFDAPETSTFPDMFEQRPKEELSKVLSLSLACIGSQLPNGWADECGSPRVVSSFGVTEYLKRVLNNNSDFIHVLQDMAKVKSVSKIGQTYDDHHAKQIVSLAERIQSHV